MSEITKKPSIRFKGFTDTWEQRELGELCQIEKGEQLGKSEMTEVGAFYVLNGGVEPSGYTDKWNTPANTISISEGGNSCGYVNFNNCRFWSGGHNYTLKNPRILTIYLYQFLKANESKIMAKRVGSGLPNIQKGAITTFPITFPKEKEQEEIAEILGSIDNLITLHQRKYDKFVNIKKSLLEKMFPADGETTPKIRFKGFTDAWEQRKFKECVTIERGGSPRPIDDYITKDANGLNWVKIGDAPEQGNYITKTAEKIKPSGLSKTRAVVPGDLILSNSMSFGKPYIMAINGCIHDGWLLIRDEKRLFDLKYLCHLLGTPQMIEQYKKLAAGSTVNNLNKDLVGNTIISKPDVKEQEAIGAIIEQLDNLITLHQRQLEKYKNIKKSLLEKMFV